MPYDDVEGFILPSVEQLDDLNEARHAAIQPMWEKYQSGDFDPIALLKPPSLKLLPSSDLTVKVDRDPESNDFVDIDVTKTSDTSAYNFMAYDTQECCVAFRGEAGLFDEFMEFSYQLVKGKMVNSTFKGASEVRVPTEGLANGLTYEEFAARVEVVEFVMWIEPIEEDEKAPKDGELLWQHCPTPHYSPSVASVHGGDETELPALDINHMADGRDGFVHSESRSFGDISPGGSSSSSLSPPPEEIKTPPHMQLPQRTPSDDIRKIKTEHEPEVK